MKFLRWCTNYIYLRQKHLVRLQATHSSHLRYVVMCALFRNFSSLEGSDDVRHSNYTSTGYELPSQKFTLFYLNVF